MNQSKEILKNTLKNDLLKVLPFEADIDFQEITRSNGEVYESMTVTPKDSQMGVNLRLDSMIDKYSKEPKSMLLSSIKDEIIEAINQMPAFDLASLSDYESIKGQLMVAPLSDLARKNQTDLVTIEKCGVKLYPVIDLGKGRIGIREKHLANYGITKEKLFSDAFANMKEKETMTIRSLSELLGQSSQEGPEAICCIKSGEYSWRGGSICTWEYREDCSRGWRRLFSSAFVDARVTCSIAI